MKETGITSSTPIDGAARRKHPTFHTGFAPVDSACEDSGPYARPGTAGTASASCRWNERQPRGSQMPACRIPGRCTWGTRPGRGQRRPPSRPRSGCGRRSPPPQRSPHPKQTPRTPRSPAATMSAAAAKQGARACWFKKRFATHPKMRSKTI